MTGPRVGASDPDEVGTLVGGVTAELQACGGRRGDFVRGAPHARW
ncbi:MAG: hypothetical protein ABI910_17350 [Gemmatimonadota bacterium]